MHAKLNTGFVESGACSGLINHQSDVNNDIIISVTSGARNDMKVTNLVLLNIGIGLNWL